MMGLAGIAAVTGDVPLLHPLAVRCTASHLATGVALLTIAGLRWRALRFHLELSGEGDAPVAIEVDGHAVERLRFAATESGERRISVVQRTGRGGPT